MVFYINKLFETVQDDSQVVKWIKEFSKVDKCKSCFAIIKVSGASIDKYLSKIVEGLGALSKLELYTPITYGWGDSLTKRLENSGIPYEWHTSTGDRITTPEAMDLTLQISIEYGIKIQEAFRQESINAEFCEGVFRAKPKNLEGISYPHCNGEIDGADIGLIMHLVNQGVIPIISPMGHCCKGHSLNINADSASSFLVEQIRPLKYCLITNTGGILDSTGGIIPRIKLTEDFSQLINSKTISGGMEKKLREIRHTLEKLSEDGLKHSVQIAHPENVLCELFTDYGKGTYIEL